MKGREIAGLAYELRDTPIKYGGTQQLRERIAQLVVPAVQKGQDLENVNDSITIETLNDEVMRLRSENERLNAIINTPQSNDFLRAVSTEAEHQRQRWGNKHDAGKTQADWYWLIGHLAGKALYANLAGDTVKAEHHIITTAPALLIWHLSMFGKTDMRPGIDPAKVDVDYCTDPNNCNRCKTHPDHRGDMEHAGIGKRPTTVVNRSEHQGLTNYPEGVDMVAGSMQTSRGHAINVMRNQVVPDDFFSHKDAWRNAIVHAVDSTVVPEDKSYWQHELNAFDRAYKELETP